MPRETNVVIDDGGQAFPGKVYRTESLTGAQVLIEAEGMTLRDWFAGQIAPLLAKGADRAAEKWDETENQALEGDPLPEKDIISVAVRICAEKSYMFADAMLKQRRINEVRD